MKSEIVVYVGQQKKFNVRSILIVVHLSARSICTLPRTETVLRSGIVKTFHTNSSLDFVLSFI